MCVYECPYLRMCVRVGVCVCVFAYVCVRICVCVCPYLRLCACICVDVCAYISECGAYFRIGMFVFCKILYLERERFLPVSLIGRFNRSFYLYFLQIVKISVTAFIFFLYEIGSFLKSTQSFKANLQ